MMGVASHLHHAKEAPCKLQQQKEMEFPFNMNTVLPSRITVVRGGVSKPNGIVEQN